MVDEHDAAQQDGIAAVAAFGRRVHENVARVIVGKDEE